MMRLPYLLLGLVSLLAAPSARAQDHHPYHYYYHDTTALEYTNDIMFLLGAGLNTDRSGHTYAGAVVDVGGSIGPRFTAAGRFWWGFSQASSNYGYVATKPELGYTSIAGDIRYQVLNSRRWRLEALVGTGLGLVGLEDRDHMVVYNQYTRGGTHYPQLCTSAHLLAEGGVGLTYKLGAIWLSSRLSYEYLPGTGGAPLGTPGEFSGWQASLSAAIPWGWHDDKSLYSHSTQHASSQGDIGSRSTETKNQLGLRLGALMARDGQGTFFNGIVIEATYFVGARIQVGGRLVATGSRPIATNFGYQATEPMLEFVNLELALRYMLSNSQRWRLDALGGSGLNTYSLSDQSRQVTNKSGGTQPVSVGFNARPVVDVGLGLTYKLCQLFWLTSDLRYARTLGSAPFGEVDLQSQWQLSVALTLASGFARHGQAAPPTVP